MTALEKIGDKKNRGPAPVICFESLGSSSQAVSLVQHPVNDDRLLLMRVAKAPPSLAP